MSNEVPDFTTPAEKNKKGKARKLYGSVKLSSRVNMRFPGAFNWTSKSEW